MEFVKLGQTDIEVSRICLGGMQFGQVFPDFHQWVIGLPETQETIKRALERGINFFDTANGYSHGTSEHFIGESLRNLGVARGDVVLASKVYYNEGKLSAKAINREIDKTLGNLGTDYLDLYIIHRYDYETPVEETLEALDSLVRAGKVRALGASEMYAYQLYGMQVCARDHGWARFESMQCHHNLLYRENERELVPLCREMGMSVTPYSPLASGHLARAEWESGSPRGRTDGTAREKYDLARENDELVVARVAEVAASHGTSMSQVALAWLLSKGEIPVVGCTSPARVDDAAGALDVALTPDEIDYLEEPYAAHELVGPAARPGEKPLAGCAAKLSDCGPDR